VPKCPSSAETLTAAKRRVERASRGPDNHVALRALLKWPSGALRSVFQTSFENLNLDSTEINDISEGMVQQGKSETRVSKDLY
jgi:hypothetical protein